MSKTTKTDDPIPGVVTEAEAAKENPAEAGQKEANARAAAHRKQDGATGDVGIVTEAEVKTKYSPDKIEADKNEQAARHRAEAHPKWAEPHVVTEVEVAAEVPDTARQAEKEQREAQPKRNTQDSKPRTTRSK